MQDSRSSRQGRQRHTMARARVLAIVSGVVLLVAAAFSVTSAATTTESWTARLGTAGAYGSVTLKRAVTDSVSRFTVSVSIKHYRPYTTYEVTDQLGNCSTPGTYVTTRLMTVRTTASGTGARSLTIGYEKGNAIIAAMAKGSVAVRVGKPCGYLKGPAAVVIPSPSPTPDTPFSPGPGVPVTGGRHGTMVVAAAEQWEEPTIPVEPGMTLDTVQIDCGWAYYICYPEAFVLRDSDGVDHAVITPGRVDGYHWLTFAVPTDLATDVTLVWTVDGIKYLVPLHLPFPPGPVMDLSLVPATGLDGSNVTDAVGTPTTYVAVGWTGGYPSQSPAAWTSTDGQAWTRHALPNVAGGVVNGVARGSSGLLVAVGEAPLVKGSFPRAAVWTSTDDGITWKRFTGLPSDSIPNGEWNGVTAVGSGFVVVGNLRDKFVNVNGDSMYYGHAAAMTSTDGSHWTRSSLVGGSKYAYMNGVSSGGAGLIAWGGSEGIDSYGSLDAYAWTSTTGDTWSIAPTKGDWRYTGGPDGGTREFDVVFGTGSVRTGILTYGWDEHRPLVYDTVDGRTWTPVDVAASLREFYPNAATPLGTDWLLGGSGVGASAWLGHDGVWAPVTVPTPAGAEPDEVARIEAFVNGPAGLIAIGTSRGVWAVPQP